MGALGHRGHGAHKNKASRGHLGSLRSGFGFYGRGNFPGHDVLGVHAKNGVNGCRCIKLDSDGGKWVYGQGRKKEQGKKSNK